MRAFQKIALSLLISVVAFSFFALFAFSGFFSFIESNFYDTRVRQQILQRVDLAKKVAADYEEQYFSRFERIIGQNSVKRINNVNQSAQDIFNRKNLFQKLLADNPGILLVRFMDQQGNIHYSTLDSDILSQNNYQTVYKPYNRVEPNSPYVSQLESTTKANAVFIEPKQGRLLFRLPWVDYQGQVVGSAVFYVGVDDFQSYLVKEGVIEPGKTLTAVGNTGFVFGADIGADTKLLDEIARDWQGPQTVGNQGTPVAAQSGGARLYLFTTRAGTLGYIGDLVPQSDFTLSTTLEVLLSVSLFLTVFLLTFLIFNLRQDKLLVLADRIKRFQISFLKEYLEGKSTLDWARWHQELALRRNEVRREIKRGIGRIGKDREAAVDGLIDKSWDEILSVIGKRVDDEPVSGREVRGLEEAIRRLLSSGELTGALARGIPAPTPAARPSAVVSARTERPGTTDGAEDAEAVEEAEALEEAEAIEEVEEIEEAEAVEENEAVAGAPTVEEANEAEAIEEAGAVEEAEAIEEIEAVEEAEAIEETEAIEEVEAVEEAEAVEEKEALAGAPTVEEANEAEAIEEAEAVEEAEEAEELEEVDEAESVDDSESLVSGIGYRSPDALADAEALDLEAIFHGEELLADIDVFEDSEPEEVEEVEEADEESETTWIPLKDQLLHGGISEEAEEMEPVEDEEYSEELEEVEPLEVTHPEIARIVAEAEDEELEEIELFNTADEGVDLATVEIGTLTDASLQPVSYGFSFFKEFQDTRAHAFRGRLDQDTFGRLVEVDESPSISGSSDVQLGRTGPRMSGDDGNKNTTGSQPREAEAVKVSKDIEDLEPVEELEEVEELDEADADPVGQAQPSTLGMTHEAASAPAQADETASIEKEDDAAAKGSDAAEEAGAPVDSTPAPRPESFSAVRPPRTKEEAAFERRIRDLIGYKKIEVYSLTDVKSMGLVPEETVEVSDGVFKVKEEVVGRSGGQGDEELKTLVDSVVSRGGIETPAIGELLYIPAVELSFGNPVEGESGERKAERRHSAARAWRRSRGLRVMLTQDGFDYDSFRAEFKSNNIGIMKSLMRLSQKVDAIYASILVPRDGGLVAEYSLGLDDQTVRLLRFDATDAVLANVFSRKQLVYIKIPKTGIDEFDSKISSKDLRFMKGTIYLPIVFESETGYLFFGLKSTEPSIQEYMLRIIR